MFKQRIPFRFPCLFAIGNDFAVGFYLEELVVAVTIVVNEAGNEQEADWVQEGPEDS